jgi:hemin uptake protein HemP
MHTLTLSTASRQPQAGLLESILPSPSDAVKSVDLLKGQKTIAIEHNGSVYRLQTTKLGKLILTK